MWFTKDTPLEPLGLIHKIWNSEQVAWYEDANSSFSVPYNTFIILNEDGTYRGFMHQDFVERDYTFVEAFTKI